MDTQALLKKVRNIEIKTRRLSSQHLSGEYHSSFKGRGMSFSEVREYQFGDDIRSIDWNVTARFNSPYVKIYEEERELTVMLMVDVSASEAFGTVKQYKRDLITELAATLAFSAIQNNDKVGVIFFSDHPELFIPPRKGRSHILRIIRELLNFRPTRRTTAIRSGLEYLTAMLKKRSIVLLLSDFLDTGYQKALTVAARKHDMAALRITDPRERELPDTGLMRLTDSETGEVAWVDTASPTVQQHYRQWVKQQDQYFRKTMIKSGADAVTIGTDTSYIVKLLHFFKQREMKR